MGISESSIWHSPPGDNSSCGLHKESWHVEQVTGDGEERELSADDYRAVLKSMCNEGWDEDEAEEWLAGFCFDAKAAVEEFKREL